VTLVCTDVPANVSCDFSAAVMTSDSMGAKATLTISTIAPVARLRHSPAGQTDSVLYAGMLSFSLTGFVVVVGVGRKRAIRFLAFALAIGGVLLLSSCSLGNKPASIPSPAQAIPGVYHLTITAASSQSRASMVTTLTIR
jgi:hypothetical protein